MGFDSVLTDLEERREAGVPFSQLVDAAPADLLLGIGYYGRAAGAADALQRLSRGLDEAIVRLITVREGDLDSCIKSIHACQKLGWHVT
jgi:hypothetical protein